jgi:hypothetical protein
MHQPSITHWNAIKRILRFLRVTLPDGLHFSSHSTFDIHAYSDSDWAGNADDRRSIIGFCIFLGSNIIFWSAKKQAMISHSSIEAEYHSLAITCTELLWLYYLLQELHTHLFLTHPHYGVITLEQLTLPLTRYFMLVQNTLKLTIILFERELHPKNFMFGLFLHRINLLTFLQNHYLLHIFKHFETS